MPMISMDGPENELAMVTIKNEITFIFYWSHLTFCNQNSAASSMIHGEMHGGGWGVSSLMIVKNGAIWFACTFFRFWQIRLGRATLQINGKDCYFSADHDFYSLRSPQGSSWMVYCVTVAVGARGWLG